MSEWDDGQLPVEMGFATVIDATPQAIKVEVDGWTYWVPKSVVHDDSEVWKLDQIGGLVVLAWWAEWGNRDPKRARRDDDWEGL